MNSEEPPHFLRYLVRALLYDLSTLRKLRTAVAARHDQTKPPPRSKGHVISLTCRERRSWGRRRARSPQKATAAGESQTTPCRNVLPKPDPEVVFHLYARLPFDIGQQIIQTAVWMARTHSQLKQGQPAPSPASRPLLATVDREWQAATEDVTFHWIKLGIRG